MKKIKTILLTLTGVTTLVAPMIAISCNNETKKDSEKPVTNPSEGTNPGTVTPAPQPGDGSNPDKTPEQSNFEKRADDLLNNKTININLANGIQKEINIDYKGSIPFIIDNKKGSVKPVKNLNTNQKKVFNEWIREMLEEIQTEVNKNIQIEYSKPEELPAKDFLIKPGKSFSGAPKFFRVKINQPQTNSKPIDILYVFSSLSQSFDNWTTGLDLGVNGSSSEDEHGKALTLTELGVKNSVVYNAYLDNDVVVNSFETRITKDTISEISPTFKTYNTSFTKPDPSIFKNVGINWNEFPEDNYFDGSIVRISDGDTFSVQLFKEKVTRQGTFYPGGAKYIPIDADKSKRDKYYQPVIRLGGIDTPEKAVDNTLSAPFEYAFALMPTNFAKQLWEMKDPETGKKFGENVRVAFLEFDAYDRVVADVFFGKDYKYSYNCEIVRAGLTLPYSNTFKNKDGIGVHENKGSYDDLVLEKIAIAMHDAEISHRGFFHYFENINEISDFIYIAKKNTDGEKFQNIYKNYINSKNNE
ncbi:thermonuclease family protein [Mycoplasma sp. VS1572C]